MIKVLGIDPGSQKMGWAVIGFGEGEPQFMNYGLLKLKTKDSLESRCVKLYDEVKYIIQANLSTPLSSYIVVEEQYVGVNSRSALTLAVARGAILAACAFYNTVSINPATWKNQTVENSHAEKELVQRYVMQYFGFDEVLPEDVSDAAAMAIVRGMEIIRRGQ